MRPVYRWRSRKVPSPSVGDEPNDHEALGSRADTRTASPRLTKRRDSSRVRFFGHKSLGYHVEFYESSNSEVQMAGQGSAGNVIAALCSFFIPGLGQLLQGRLIKAVIQFVLAGLLWIILMGWIIHLWSILDAATYKPRP